MTALSDSVVFRNVFATPESRAIWSDERRTEYFLKFEACLAEAQAELGIVRLLEEMKQIASDEHQRFHGKPQI